MKQINYRLLATATIFVYVLCNLLMIASPGAWWDDWTIFNAAPDSLWNQFVVEGGQPIIGRFHYWAVQNVDNHYLALLYHWISFLSGGISLVAVWHILRSFTFSDFSFSALMLLIASSPLCSARISMACLFYPLTGALFLLGSWFFIIYIKNGKFGYRLLSFVTFMIGLCIWLTSAVLIPVFILLMAVYVQKEIARLDKSYIISIIGTLVKWWEFCLIPVFILILRKIFFTPVGRYSDYEITLVEWLRTPIVMMKGLYGCTVGYVKALLRCDFNDTLFLVVAILILVICIFLACRLLSKCPNPTVSFPIKKSYLFLVAIVLFFAAIMPSSTMNSATMGGFTSRYYVLALVPYAIIVLLLLSYLKRSIVGLTLGIVLGFNIIININDQLQFQKQWIKDEAIADFFIHTQLNQYENILFNDDSKSLNAYYDQYRYYEYCGIYRMIRPEDQTHFMADSEWAKKIPENMSLIKQELVNCKEAKNIDSFQRLITLEAPNDITLKNVIISLYIYYIDKDHSFGNNSKFLKITVKEIN